ncbi:MAG: hypothetical protein H0W50_02565 [Parachlamydiaceae bacterium]|nr:hypothetical protein [Parachlamydiaceae bacterium]
MKQLDFELPNGLHSGVVATYKDKWLFFAGRTNGLHGFNQDKDNFPPQKQNIEVYVVDVKSKKVKSRSLTSIGSGLTTTQVDLLSVTSPQYYQESKTLYITGGYGVDTSSGLFDTKSALTAVDVPGLIHWVTHPDHNETAVQNIRQIFDPIFQVTGGYMTRIKDHSTLLVFGQNFDGYYLPQSNGVYTEVARRFKIIDDGNLLAVEIKASKPLNSDRNYRRRDLNVIPSIEFHEGKWKPYLVALSGVFTSAGGAWTVPVTISASGRPSMNNPEGEHTFKQGMNNYICPSPGLYSKHKKIMYTILLGGISYGYFENGQFETDLELPFINQVTVIERHQKGHFKQYLLDAQYPVILSTGSNPGNQLLFGAAADFLPAEGLKFFKNGVIELDYLLKHDKSVTIGYVVGGIQSTLPNTSSNSDTSASPYIFKVKLKPQVK